MFKKLFLFALVLGVILTGILPTHAAATVTVDPGGIGDVNLCSLYDVRQVNGRTNGWQNFVVIENTSAQWTAVHLRFRGWKKSIEVFDHVILLSPYDVFWVVMQLATKSGQTSDSPAQNYTAGEVLLWSSDYETCYNSGLTYAPKSSFVAWVSKLQSDLLDDCGFIANLNSLTDLEKAETQAGEIEVIGLWQLSNPNDPLSDTHDLSDVVGEVYPDGAINVYDVMNALYYDYTKLPADAPPAGTRTVVWPGGAGQITAVEYGADTTVRTVQDCGNVLASSISMSDVTNGRFQSANFVALKNFRTDNQAHRDLTTKGPIVYPIETLFWSWSKTPLDTNVPYYVNENWATTVGAGFIDGDDQTGVGQTTGGCGNWTVDGFNNTWSLDDVETALSNSQIWYPYYNGAFGAQYTTDVVLSFITKHYHYFFADFPWFGKVTAPYLAGGGNDITTQAQYWEALYDYRGSRGPTKIGAFARRHVEYVDTLTCNLNKLTIAGWFQSKYGNGPVSTATYVYDMDQNHPGADYTPPPGSPWHPVTSGKFIPHEVNIVRVGAPTPTTTGYITDGNGILTNKDPNNYTMGQFQIVGTSLTNGQRQGGPIYAGAPGAPVPYSLSAIGSVIFDLNYANQGGIDLYRSTMAPWHYVH
jgi:hypothetical protein